MPKTMSSVDGTGEEALKLTVGWGREGGKKEQRNLALGFLLLLSRSRPPVPFGLSCFVHLCLQGISHVLPPPPSRGRGEVEAAAPRPIGGRRMGQ